MNVRILSAAMMIVLAGGRTMAADLTDNISLKGDVRYRHEMIDKQGSETRNRNRVRARIEVKAKVNDTLKAGIKLASGSDDPVSSNQTLDGAFGSKGINLDKAYFDWSPKPVTGVNIIGGKMGKPWIVVKDLVWDGDLNPEGIAVKYETGDGVKVMANAGGFWVEERKADDDTMLYAGQLAVGVKNGVDITAGVGYYHFTEMEGRTTLADAEDSFGNSSVDVLDINGDVESLDYACDFQELECFVEACMKAGSLPVTLYGQYVVNNEADSNDTGYLAGIKMGKAKNPGQVEVDYNYRELERDAVVGAFTDSDSFGGGTDGKGSKIAAKLKIAKHWDLAAAYFINDLGLSGSSKDYDRLQLDLKLKF